MNTDLTFTFNSARWNGIIAYPQKPDLDLDLDLDLDVYDFKITAQNRFKLFRTKKTTKNVTVQ